MYILFVCNFLNAKEIINIRDWNHPTKEIFYNENIELKKVVINNKNFPIFYINESPKNFNFLNYIFLSLLAEKNGYWDFEIKIKNNYIKIFCDKHKKRVIKIETKSTTKQFDNYSYNEAKDIVEKLIIETQNLIYVEEEKCYYNKKDETYIILKSIGFDEYGRFEVIISPVDYPLSVYNHFYVDLLTDKIYEE